MVSQKDPRNIFFRCVEDSNEAIMLSDEKGVLFYVNPAWERIYGYTSDEALGQTPRIIHSGHHAPEFYKEMWTAIGDPAVGTWRGEIVNRAKDGRLVPVMLTIAPYKSDDGRIEGYMGIALDLSHRKELEAKVAHQDRLASIGLLASGLAHEVGTPLGVIRGRAEYVMMRSGDPSIQRSLEVVISQIDRISKLIRSLLRVSRGFTDIRMEPVSPQQVVSEVLALVGQNLREDSVDIMVNVPDGLRVRADFNRLEQVILNLVMNSIYAIRKAIQGGRPTGHVVTIETTAAGGRVVLEVKDSGCGIAPENMKKLFQPFFTTKDIGEGTGLGLAIVAQLVHEMDGEISARSTVNEGTTFRVVLRAAE